jgi:hypothetical protein
MTRLSIEEYNQAESDAVIEIPNRVLEAVQPVVFQELSYPFRVRTEAELKKYVDVMHEMRFEPDFTHLLGGLTNNEYELVQKLTETICRFTNTRFGETRIARATVMKAVNILRHIRFIFGQERPQIFEIGPGCGYLGALLIMEGYPYVSTEISQAFYLYQNHFWDFLTDGNVLDLVREKDSVRAIRLSTAQVIHIPWWHFVRFTPETMPKMDVFTANHVLCEMHPAGLSFALQMARAAMGHENAKKLFLFEGWGWSAWHSHALISWRFSKSGFTLAHNDPAITVFASSSTDGAVNGLALPRYSQKLQRNLKNVLRCCLRAGALPAYVSYKPKNYSSLNNPYSARIILGRSALNELRPVSSDQLNSYYTKLLGSDELLTPDEKFWKFTDYA